MRQEELKRDAARAAVAAEVKPGMRLGLGTGSTVVYALEALGEALRLGTVHDIVGVPTSIQTEQRARDLGIALAALHEVEALDVTIDGADEISPELDLIKGLGGALLQEKMVAQATRRLVIIADESKRVARLGQKAPLPVEVVRCNWRWQLGFLESLGAQPVLREKEGSPYETDCGNYLIDCHFEQEQGIHDPAVLEWELLGRAGVIDHGLFLEMAAIAYIAGGQGVTTLERETEGEA